MCAVHTVRSWPDSSACIMNRGCQSNRASLLLDVTDEFPMQVDSCPNTFPVMFSISCLMYSCLSDSLTSSSNRCPGCTLNTQHSPLRRCRGRAEGCTPALSWVISVHLSLKYQRPSEDGYVVRHLVSLHKQHSKQCSHFLAASRTWCIDWFKWEELLFICFYQACSSYHCLQQIKQCSV